MALAAIFLFGISLQAAFQQYPQLNQIVNLIDNDSLLAKVDVNSATAEELEAVPYIGAYTAGQIVKYRRNIGKFLSLDQLKSVKGIKQKNFEKFSKYLFISGKPREPRPACRQAGRGSSVFGSSVEGGSQP